MIETLPGPVFIHCQHGCDRTGTVIACYRIKHDKWPTEKAFKEAMLHGFSWLERGMKRSVLAFGKALESAGAGERQLRAELGK
jgi:protein tyrosine/serine phosphatase